MINRNQRAKIAHETVEVLDRGFYETKSGKRVEIEPKLSYAIKNTKLYGPGSFTEIKIKKNSRENTLLQVTNETTLSTAERLEIPESAEPFVLNFASARNPGGGFLNGSGAQEESLARATGLYACISEVTDYYQRNRQSEPGLYTDNMIYSPRVPVIRSEDGEFRDRPYSISILTAPAVNKKVVEREIPEKLSEVKPTMDERIKKVLKVAAEQNHELLVLGAWGCGVFGNDPKVVAKLFKNHLVSERSFKGIFDKVVFAVLDRTQRKNTYNTFKRTLGGD